MKETTDTFAAGGLTDSDRTVLERLRRDERQRFVFLIANLVFGGLFVWRNWNAPFVYNELGRLPYSEASKNPYYDMIHMVPWLMGCYLIVRGIYDCFFNRRRKLLLKLAGMLAHSGSEVPRETPGET